MDQNGNSALWGRAADVLLKAVLTARPKVTGAECIGCGECGRMCPAKAIQMEESKEGKKLPVIDRKACIRCFCCQEFCPKGAMKVHRPIIAKLASKI